MESVPKQHSKRSAPATQKVTRKSAPGFNHGRVENTALSAKGKMHYCELARSEVITAWPRILQGLIDKAMSGGCQQAKLLLELCDLSIADPLPSRQQHQQQLCDALLEGLRLPIPKPKRAMTECSSQNDKDAGEK